MLTTDSVTTRFIDDDQAQRITGHWNAVYPRMREILTSAIDAQRAAEQPSGDPRPALVRELWPATADLAMLEGVRRDLGQLDRGTFKDCACSTGAFSVGEARDRVHQVLNITSTGDPALGAIYRLAGELADLHLAWQETARAVSRAQAEAAVPGPRLDRGPGDRADSEQTERGLTR
ncbi:hypothetical protein OHS33_39325 (plasmid) [Streptomyces sp. NBC_00536]|uniref:hypothetical protein n=1 Tax=Streptomyces sp. NBC_00536 TaxID=2975769 RepID=UPI002E81C401|nr:hypothetical protein [Streptomyces sp. NBC_00536]WUC84507.1 hypothetical protein OHS33_39325 [Streptomyces sp. NBC_00536]